MLAVAIREENGRNRFARGAITIASVWVLAVIACLVLLANSLQHESSPPSARADTERGSTSVRNVPTGWASAAGGFSWTWTSSVDCDGGASSCVGISVASEMKTCPFGAWIVLDRRDGNTSAGKIRAVSDPVDLEHYATVAVDDWSDVVWDSAVFVNARCATRNEQAVWAAVKEFKAAGSPSSPPTSPGPGGGASVVCSDGTVSDAGGIQGACSFHGGIG